MSIVPQNFRDALACHIYMLYNVMCLSEAEAKADKQQNSMKSKSTSSKGKNKQKNASFDSAQSRKQCATTMLQAAETMTEYKSILWKCGVPDENVISLPCRIAFQMMELATSVQARKLACADEAMGMIAATVASGDFSVMSTIVTALMDLLHSYEHIAPLVAELCCFPSIDNKVNRLAVQLLQEIGRSDFSVGKGSSAASSGDATGRASGVKNVAPFISELASLRPRIVLDNIIHILPLLNCESYMLRNAVVFAIGHIVARYPNEDEENEQNDELDQSEYDSSDESESGSSSHKKSNINKTRDSLLDVLIERTHDKSSYTRSAVLRAWAQLTESNSIPLDRLMPVTELAVDRLQDFSVNVRSKAMKVSTVFVFQSEKNDF